MSNVSKSVLRDIAKEARLAVEAEPADEHQTAAGQSLISRHEAASKLDSLTLIRTEKIDPKFCRPSPQNARDYSKLTYENCQDLIESIREEGAQHTPALVRQTGDADVPYEIVTGSRRHFAVTWLRANNYPQIDYLIELRELGDEEAFRLSDEENRARKDVTDLERAKKYASALETYYGGSIDGMARRLAVSPQTIRRLLLLAELPDVLIDAYGGQYVVTVSHARAITPELRKSDEAQERILEEAGHIATEQRELADKKSPLIPPKTVFARLVKAAKEKRGSKAVGRMISVKGADGGEVLSYTRPTKVHGLSVKVPREFAGSGDDLIAAFTAIVRETFPGR